MGQEGLRQEVCGGERFERRVEFVVQLVGLFGNYKTNPPSKGK